MNLVEDLLRDLVATLVVALNLEDLDQHPEQGGEVDEEESCQCSLTATISSLSLNLF